MGGWGMGVMGVVMRGLVYNRKLHLAQVNAYRAHFINMHNLFKAVCSACGCTPTVCDNWYSAM